MTTLQTSKLAYRKNSNAFYCNVDTLGKRGVDVLSLGEHINVYNPATGGNRVFKYKHQSTKYWCYQTQDNSLSLLIYKGDRHLDVVPPVFEI